MLRLARLEQGIRTNLVRRYASSGKGGTGTVKPKIKPAAAPAAKRALDEAKLKGPESTPPPPPSSSSGSSPWTGAVIALTAVTAGGAAYCFSTNNEFCDQLKQTLGVAAPPPPEEAKAAAPEPVVEEEEEPAVEETPVEPVVVAKEETEEPTTTTTATETVPVVEDEETAAMVDAAMEEPSPEAVVVGVASETATPPAEEPTPPKVGATEMALQELQATAQSAVAKSLVRSTMASSSDLVPVLQEMETMDAPQLKARIVQLATELQERTRWEALRLQEFLALKEKETAQQYTELLQRQRLEYEDLLAKQLREQEQALQQQLMAALQQKDASIQALVNAALEAQQEEHNQQMETFAENFKAETKSQIDMEYSQQMQAYKENMMKDLEEKVATLEAFSAKLKQLEANVADSQRSQKGSTQAHRLSAAALALSEKLETRSAAGSEVDALGFAAGRDGVIATAIRTLPSSVRSSGVATLSELQSSFEEKYATFRQAALVPQGRPGLEGQLAGMLFASLKYAPHPDDPAPPDNPHHPEYVLARARQNIQLGRLAAAIEELEKLKGQVAFAVADWKQDAMDRVAVDKALKVIKLECASLNESLAH